MYSFLLQFSPLITGGSEYFCRKTGIYKSWIDVVYNLAVYLVLPVPILCFNYIRSVRSLLTSIKRSREMTGDSRYGSPGLRQLIYVL